MEEQSVSPAPGFMSMANQFLMAMPSQNANLFEGGVVYVCEHSEQGALGLLLNRPTDLSVKTLLERLELEINEDQPKGVVFYGGPVQTDRGFVLHSPVRNYRSSVVLGDMALTTSRDVLEDVAKGKGPEKVFISLGYSGWNAGQLEQEIADNAWLNVEADMSVIFDKAPAERYVAALALLGIEPSSLSGEAGHA
ncbi:YqgE/AlgH family protein [Advenella sp. RU8]|uniref:YqgE/AlgH family protein n=1 Tax=Advenella sp. RU8 TaxID=3399575 RepID=UPI003AAAE297